jgi:hypothetical protein
MKLKTCSKCKAKKPTSEFYSDKNTNSGFTAWCGDCMREAQRKYKMSETGKITKREGMKRYRGKHKEKIAKDKDRYYHANKDKISVKRKEQSKRIENRYRSLTYAARNKGLGFDITFGQYKEMVINGSCYYCGNSIDGLVGHCMDRMDNTKGYLINNVLPCCPTCNYSRGNYYTVEEFKIMIDALTGFRENKLIGRI